MLTLLTSAKTGPSHVEKGLSQVENASEHGKREKVGKSWSRGCIAVRIFHKRDAKSLLYLISYVKWMNYSFSDANIFNFQPNGPSQFEWDKGFNTEKRARFDISLIKVIYSGLQERFGANWILKTFSNGLFANLHFCK